VRLCLLENAVIKSEAAPMSSFDVLANTTWESLQKARAYCCVPVGLVSNLMCNYIYGF